MPHSKMHKFVVRCAAARLFRFGLAAALALAFWAAGRAPGAHAQPGSRWYVDAGAAGLNTGLSWDDAFIYLQDALLAAGAGDEIWVAAGTYRPGLPGDGRALAFDLPQGVAVYGGFAGTEDALSQRDWAANVVTLSGDLAGDDGPNFANNTENAYHVVTGSDNTRLDGVTVSGGNANGGGYGQDRGGGMIVMGPYSGGVVANVTFTGNKATTSGGGLYLTFDSTGSVEQVTFSRNAAGQGGGATCFGSGSVGWTFSHVMFDANTADGYGGGLYLVIGITPLTDVTFRNNLAGQGGGLYSSMGELTVSGVSFLGNSAAGLGGGLYTEGGALSAVNVVFAGNDALLGGGLYSDMVSPQITNATFTSNSSLYGEAIFAGGGTLTLANSIVWGQLADPLRTDGGSIVASYSDIQGGYAGTGNLNVDPQFVDLPGGDVHLRPGSPVIDQGDNASVSAARDRDGGPRKFNGVADMGAYEWHIVYVDVAASGDNSGDSWENANPSLQDAITTAGAGTHFWVANGTYLPAQAGGSRSASFALKPYMELYGGFAGGETALDQRSIYANLTTLSGDRNFDDFLGASYTAENSYHVVIAANHAVLDGFTIQRGNANGAGPLQNGGCIYNDGTEGFRVKDAQVLHCHAEGLGGGMYNHASSPVLETISFGSNTAGVGGGLYNHLGSPNLNGISFAGNWADVAGGGMFTQDGAPAMADCAFRGNASLTGGGLELMSEMTMDRVWFEENTAQYGGGLVVNLASGNPVFLSNVTFHKNSASVSGGGLHNLASDLRLNGATFDENTALSGGALRADGGYAELTNVTFAANVAANQGSAIYSSESELALTNVTVGGNQAAEGAFYYYGDAPVAVQNSIFWGDSGGEMLKSGGGTLPVSNSIVQGGYPGSGNLNADPLLAELANYGGVVKTMALLPGSAAIHAAPSNCPERDGRGVVRGGPACDRGAFESMGFKLELSRGGGQIARPNAAFAVPLEVTVSAWNSQEPVNGGRVTFTVVQSAQGAGARLTASPAAIANGKAQVSASANAIEGAYTVTAAANGASTPASFSLANLWFKFKTFLPFLIKP